MDAGGSLLNLWGEVSPSLQPRGAVRLIGLRRLRPSGPAGLPLPPLCGLFSDTGKPYYCGP